MWSAAQVHKVIACPVDGYDFVFRKILDELCLILLIFKELESLRPTDLLACPVFLALNNLGHLILDRLVVVFCDRTRQSEIIVAAVSDLRSDRVLHIVLAEHLDHCLG